MCTNDLGVGVAVSRLPRAARDEALADRLQRAARDEALAVDYKLESSGATRLGLGGAADGWSFRMSAGPGIPNAYEVIEIDP